MREDVNINDIIYIKGKYYICKKDGEGEGFSGRCLICDFSLFSDECMRFECTTFGRCDKTSVYFEQISPVPPSEVQVWID